MAGSWNDLPWDVWVIIFEILRRTSFKVSKERFDPSERALQNHTASAYATVCRAWQSFFEKRNFRTLVLHQSDIPLFEHYVHGERRYWVEWVWLRVELPKYNCRKCHKQESPKEIRRNNTCFTNAIARLFAVLSTWPIYTGYRHRGVALDLSVHSPSDVEHFCQELKSQSYDSAWIDSPEWPDLISWREVSIYDEKHCWIGTEPRPWLGRGELRRVFGRPGGLSLDFRASYAKHLNGTLPKVVCVSLLIIRRQFYRHYSVSNALKPILHSLQGLHGFRYEPWRGVDTEGRSGLAIRDEEHRLLLSELGNMPNLGAVSLFENSAHDYHGRIIKEHDPALAEALAKSSQNLANLHISHMIDGKDFLNAAYRDVRLSNELMWHRLKFISLTSPALSINGHDTLIQTAAVAARSMPLLDLMEIWHAEQHQACIFRFSRVQDRPCIQLFSTWSGPFSARAISRWKAATRDCHYELEQEIYSLTPASASSGISILPHLNLVVCVLHLRSLCQLLSLLEPSEILEQFVEQQRVQ
ncbi:uncharacterized protein E0L32_001353 [Thyridium curvatum]|uniref:DUF6546 domain-containing protein n=1 Tax=Thyridium curvatum TaxID=1093900 RepID=A0A507ATX7_9PEZI|nr:uncharacterized protein E0L32_001353 [Thyridium curvatum]TPX10156.1 hypothetical protein E0L32_001353 [Thyridium curvatum]